MSFTNGAVGGYKTAGTYGGDGGFGGGGGGKYKDGNLYGSLHDGGGGGGYSGGAGGTNNAGGGGGSFNSGTNTYGKDGANTGYGKVIITLLSHAPTITMNSPTEGQVITESSTDLNVSITGTGHDHWHYRLDTTFPASGTAGGEMVMSGSTVTLTNLSPGSHVIHAALVDASHNLLSPSVTHSVTFTVEETNHSPENLTLDNEFVDEAQPPGAFVGQLAATDPDGDPLTYSLVAGPGDYHNAAFKMNGNVLETAVELDYETGYLCYLRLAADDGKGGRVEQSIVVQVRNVFIPIVKTLPAGEVTHDRADLSGHLLADGFSPVLEMGVEVSRDWQFSPNDPSTRRVPAPALGAQFALSVGQLEPATRYYYRAYAVNGEGTAYGAKKRFTTKRAPQNDPWGQATSLGNGWFDLPWFGTFRTYENGWIFHHALSWAYASGTSEDDVWLWSPDWGWLWTSAETYPHLHSHGEQTWLYLIKDASGKTVFHHYRMRQWLSTKP